MGLQGSVSKVWSWKWLLLPVGAVGKKQLVKAGTIAVWWELEVEVVG